ncbi:hypothetical protein [Phytomonospora endophytica]|uniref:Uncharacterized protein n=1 Tax=Phytomonospora endophytica TaxID=714109 RepID=A0A841FUK3_9ACTN|nr:hypothetical protein [Phytomonospora endophytica]MBB6037232.1 hypothetical protein [Phytomonospora endophytica]
MIAWLVVNADEMTERAEAAKRKLPKLRPIPQPPIEEIAAELRRLSTALARTSSEARRAVLREDRDRALRQACAALGVDQHLDGLDGLDLEIERVRVTGALQRAGLHIDETRREPNRQDRQ